MAVDQLAIGLTSGVAASGPMTLMMEAAHRLLPNYERDPLPPRHITERLLQILGINHKLTEEQSFALTLLSHFAYGGAAGCLYAPLAKKTGVQPIMGGVVFGTLVWAASYLGFLPAIGAYPSPAKDPFRRTVLMVLAHWVWGATLGMLVHSAQQASEESASMSGSVGSMMGVFNARR